MANTLLRRQSRRNGRRFGEWCEVVDYDMVPDQPSQDVLRDTAAWQRMAAMGKRTPGKESMTYADYKRRDWVEWFRRTKPWNISGMVNDYLQRAAQ